MPIQALMALVNLWNILNETWEISVHPLKVWIWSKKSLCLKLFDSYGFVFKMPLWPFWIKFCLCRIIRWMLHTGGGWGDTPDNVERFECLEKRYINVTNYYFYFQWRDRKSQVLLKKYLNLCFWRLTESCRLGQTGGWVNDDRIFMCGCQTLPYSFTVFLFFFSTVGQEVINKVALESRQAGRDREDILPKELEDSIADAVYNNKNSECHRSSV